MKVIDTFSNNIPPYHAFPPGSPLRISGTHFSVGGKHILAQLVKLMCETYSFNESDMAIVNDIKVYLPNREFDLFHSLNKGIKQK